MARRRRERYMKRQSGAWFLLIPAILILVAITGLFLYESVFGKAGRPMGTYRMTVPLGEDAGQRIVSWLSDAEGADRIDPEIYKDDYIMYIMLTIDENGNWTRTPDRDSYDKALSDIYGSFEKGIRELVRIRLTDAGEKEPTDEELDGLIREVCGMDVRDYAQTVLPDLAFSYEDLLSAYEASGRFDPETDIMTADDGKRMSVLYDASTLVLKDAYGDVQVYEKQGGAETDEEN